jgi:hypothetical protein
VAAREERETEFREKKRVEKKAPGLIIEDVRFHSLIHVCSWMLGMSFFCFVSFLFLFSFQVQCIKHEIITIVVAFRSILAE